jgi:hypothetical protein
MKSHSMERCLLAFFLISALCPRVSAQFRDDFDSLRIDSKGTKGWLFRPGDGTAQMVFKQGGEGYASIFVDATHDQRGIWWALIERKVSEKLDLSRLNQPGMRLRIEARIRVSHAPRRVNLQLFNQKTTDFHSNLMEYEIPDTNNWHVISWTPPDFNARPGDQVTAHMALMDWGPEKYRVDVDYIKVDAVNAAAAGPDVGIQVPYHPPIADPATFASRVPVSQDCMIDLENTDVNLNNWSVQQGTRRIQLLTVDGTHDVILRWDLRSFAGKRVAGPGLLELTTCSVERDSDEIKDFGIVRVVEIPGGDPAWDQKTVTTKSLCRGKPLNHVLNTQPIIDWPITEGDGAKTYLTIPTSVLQRLVDGKTLGIAVKPLGAIHAAFYSMEDVEDDGGSRSAKLLFNLETR